MSTWPWKTGEDWIRIHFEEPREPLGDRIYGISVYSMSNRWEKTPYTGGLRELVKVMTTALAHFLASPW